MMPRKSRLRADVAVVGKGPAGAAAALELARRGARVVVLDRGVCRPTLGESLPPGATPVLRQLGLWERFLSGGHAPAYGNRSTWGISDREASDFIRSPWGNGWQLDRRRFDRMLDGALREAGVEIGAGARLLECSSHGGRWTLSLQSGGVVQQLDAGFVIDASGRARRLTRLLGIGRRVYDRLVGAVGVLAPVGEVCDARPGIEIEASPDGWWYASALPDGRLVAGYMTDADGETGKRARTSDGWKALFDQTTHLRKRIADHDYRLQGPLQRVAADSSRLERFAGDGWCAAGDAAAAHDPLSSHGITSAVCAGTHAAHAIAADHPVDYEEWMRHEYAYYLAQWLGYYALERRWAGSPFWQRRHRALEQLQ
jgi:flavin-dependent dehydrogenase